MKNALPAARPALLTALLLSLGFAAFAQTPPAQTSPVQTSPVQTSPIQTSPAQTPYAQQPAIVLAHIADATPPDQALAPLIYLASDQLKGRYIGRPEIDSAARYIANQFIEAGARPVPGAMGYFQLFTHHFNANSMD